jgi:hypothetical protein
MLVRTLVRLTVIVALLSLPLAASGPAQAAIQVGNECSANTYYPGNTVVQLSQAPGSPRPITAPIDGVVTSWQMITSVGEPFAEAIKVMHPTPSPTAFEVTAESGYGIVSAGTNTFATRLPVQVGDRFGGYGIKGALTCHPTGTTTDKMGFEAGNPTPGSPFASSAEHGEELSPVLVKIEPDGDHDGYGDETQDSCPQDASAQRLPCPAPITPAPPFSIELLPQTHGTAAVVLISSSAQSSISVSGVVKLGKGAQAKLSGGTRAVSPGQIGRFRLRFPKALTTRLDELSPKQSLKLSLQAKATDQAGRVASRSTGLKLRGRD